MAILSVFFSIFDHSGRVKSEDDVDKRDSFDTFHSFQNLPFDVRCRRGTQIGWANGSYAHWAKTSKNTVINTEPLARLMLDRTAHLFILLRIPRFAHALCYTYS